METVNKQSPNRGTSSASTVDGQALFTAKLRLYASIHKEIKRQSTTEQQGSEPESRTATRTKQMSREKKDSEDDSCTKKKNPPPDYHEPLPAAASIFSAPLEDIPMDDVEPSSEEGPTGG
jgi:hypothetical protein